MNWLTRSVSCRAGASIIALGVAFGAAAVPLASMAQTTGVSAVGGQISDIRVEGNQRIEPPTVLSYMTVSKDQTATPAEINASVKALFATGLFRDVQIERRGPVLVVMVDENPVVNQIAFEGNDRLPDESLRAGVTSRERRVFTRAKAESDAEEILEAYRRSGRYGASVEPKIIELPQNRVDLVFEIEEGPLTGVDSIRFVGNRAFSDRRLRSEIPTDESSWYNFLSSTDSYDPDRLELDKQVLRQFYLSNGYADFEVTSAVAELSPDRSGFFLTFTVTEGERFDFGPIDVISNADGVNVEELRSLISTVEGDVYDIREIEETITEMTFRLGEGGYAFTRINPIPAKNDENNTIGLTYEINEGQRVFVERIDITGNTRTLDRVIRRNFELVEGDAFNALQLRRSRSKIRALGFFSDVDVRTREGSTPDRIVVETEVKEQSTGQLSVGVGFSTSENVSGEVSIIERNLLGRGQALRVRARVSGRTALYDLSFTEPAFLDRDLAIGFDLFRRETDNQDSSSFDIVNTGFQPRVSFPLGRFSRLSPRYRISLDEIVDVPDDASPLIQTDRGEAITSSLGYEFVYDRRNDATEPKDGFIARFEQDFAGLGGDARYIKTEASIKGFTTLFSDDIVGSLELAGGSINSFGGYDLKASDRFFLGGDTLRGFETAGVGPRDQNLVNGQRLNDTLGGNFFGVARAEITFPLGLPEEYGLAGGLFGDVGTVWGLDTTSYEVEQIDANGNGNGVFDTFSVDDSAKLRAAVGATIFWTSPFGPVRLNFAAPILQEDGDDDEFFRFSAGTRF